MVQQAILTSAISSFIFLLYWVFKWLITKIKSEKENTNKNNNIIKINNTSETQKNDLRTQREIMEVKNYLEGVEMRLNHLIKAFSIYVQHNGSDKETKELIKKILDDFI